MILTARGVAGLLASLASPILATTNVPPSSKRGLIYISDLPTPKDAFVWRREPSDLTWYYNYGATPSMVFSNWTQSQFEFVPMLWGARKDSPDDNSFYQTVSGLIDDRGINITHVLTFNEPDGPSAYGGSDIDPAVAAHSWVKNIIPLQEKGVKAGLPACTGGTSGLPWLRQFLGNCSDLISQDGTAKNCSYEFATIHWYGNFEGLASHLGEYAAAFPNTTQWITEYNFDNQDLKTTQEFFQMSADYMDKVSISSVERYSFFGSFRSDQSNVGANGAMLSKGGELTDIGAWYLGRNSTGVLPSSTEESVASRMAVVPVIGAGALALGVSAFGVLGF